MKRARGDALLLAAEAAPENARAFPQTAALSGPNRVPPVRSLAAPGTVHISTREGRMARKLENEANMSLRIEPARPVFFAQ